MAVRRSRIPGQALSLVVLLVVQVVLVAGGCSEGKGGNEGGVAEGDSGGALEGFLAEFAGFASADPAVPIDVGAILDLVHVETGSHQKMLEIARGSIPAYAYARMLHERFPGDIAVADFWETAFLIMPTGAATVVTRDGRRASASYPGLEGGTEWLQLVEVDGRWRISGYTWEQDEDSLLFKDAIDYLAFAIELNGAVLPRITERLEAGEFKAFVDCTRAAQIASAEYMGRHPEMSRPNEDFSQALKAYVERRRSRAPRR